MISAPTAIHSSVSMPCSSFRYPTIFFIPASSCAHRVLCGEACDGTTLDFTFDLSSLLLSLESCGLPPPPHPDVSPLGCTSYALTSANPLHSRASTTAAIRSLGTRNPWCSWKSSGCTAGDVPGSMKFGRRWQDAQTRQAVESDCARDTNPGASEA